MLQSFIVFLSDDPSLRLLQLLMLTIGIVVVFLVFFTLRDVLLRTKSFPLQLASLILVAFLPIIGSLVYLLLRPARTVRERQTDEMIRQLHARFLRHDREKGEKEKEKEKHPKKSETRIDE